METTELKLKQLTLKERLEKYENVLREIWDMSSYLEPSTISIPICGFLNKRTETGEWKMQTISTKYEGIERIVLYQNDSVPERFLYIQTKEHKPNALYTMDYLFLLKNKDDVDFVLNLVNGLYQKNTLMLIYKLRRESLLSIEIHKGWEYSLLLDLLKLDDIQKKINEARNSKLAENEE